MNLEDEIINNETQKNKVMTKQEKTQEAYTNNEWIKIESRDDLPKDFNEYWVINNKGEMHMTEFNPDYKKFNGYFLAGDGAVTHYQTIPKPEPPLY